jgi:citrate lyase beta subunit
VLRLQACIFGADDYCASLAMRREPGSDDTLFARRWVALHARAFGLQPIDQVMVRSSACTRLWRQCRGKSACTAMVIRGCNSRPAVSASPTCPAD